ncbi:MAG TPA: plasma-membrane proton-efflux P-type ATPase [Gammaproteobacteria bacterium]|nr:plasma-membrane proton-efflux P-type ATPase [Gammaproteobacteria bacterium]
MAEVDPAELKTDIASGLSTAEARARQQKYGLNRIETREKTWWQRLLARFWGPIPWMIETAAVLSAVVQRWEDFVIIVIMLLVNAFVDFYQESKALNAIEVLKSKLALKALVRRDGKWQTLDAAELVPGDIIKLKIGNIIPADVRLLGEGDFLQVDQSALTGESLPVDKKAGDAAFANTVVKQGEMVAVVTGTGLNTEFGRTVGLVARAEMAGRSHFKQMVIKVGDFLIVLTLVVITIIILLALQRHESFTEVLIFALVLTISAIPVAMPAVLTVTMAIGAVALARHQAIVSRLDAIEELAGVDVLCSDKTGTLTQNRMSLAEPYVEPSFQKTDLFLYAALASREENQDPIEAPIFAEVEKLGLRDRLGQYRIEKFIPFDPVRKRTEAVLAADGRRLAAIKGAPQVVIDLCNDRHFDKARAHARVEAFAEKGFRTLGVAVQREGAQDFTFVGLIPLFDPPREDSKEVIAQIKAQGVEVKMVTGDNLAVARTIAQMLDIGDNIQDVRELKGQTTEEYLFLARLISQALVSVLESNVSEEEAARKADEVVDLVRKELNDLPLPPGTVRRHESEIIEHIEKANGFAQVYPEDKYFIVEKLQKADHIVGMTGDGVNDAPALKKADAGIAVSGATDAARAAAAIVLTAPGLGVILEAIKQARITFERMQSYTIFRIAETIRIIFFMGLAIGVFQFYPVTALMIIVLALLNDIPILAIAYDNTKVRNHPIRWDMHEVLVMAGWLGMAGVLSSFALFWYTMVYLKLPLDFVQSVFFAKLVIAGHGTIYNTRIDDWFFRRPWPSWILFSATFSSRVAGTIIAVYGFGLMTPIGWEWALGMWAYALTWFVFNDAVKMAVLRYYRKRKASMMI